MQYKLITLLPLQIARVIGLIRKVEIALLEEAGRPSWVLLVQGSRFTRIIRDEPLPMPGIYRPMGWDKPRPLVFPSQLAARSYAESLGLLPGRQRWSIKSPRCSL